MGTNKLRVTPPKGDRMRTEITGDVFPAAVDLAQTVVVEAPYGVQRIGAIGAPREIAPIEYDHPGPGLIRDQFSPVDYPQGKPLRKNSTGDVKPSK